MTALEAYTECLHVLERLDPDERRRVIEALHTLALMNARVLTSRESEESPP